MKQDTFHELLSQLTVEGKQVQADELDIFQTHISFILIYGPHAYKIKKSVSLGFLDFSQLSQRAYYCKRELFLNRRLSPEMYLDVLEIRRQGDRFFLGGQEGEVVDYAVKMKRMDNSHEMDLLIEHAQVHEGHMQQLAEVISRFHADAFALPKRFSVEHMSETFNQVGEWKTFVIRYLGEEYGQTIDQAIAFSDQFLKENMELLNLRSRKGLVRDVHGDLHSQNIFLFDRPVIFDCIEFDDDLRQIDLMNEIAFFVMDLDFNRASDLSAAFLKAYESRMHELGLPEAVNRKLLRYFSLYRATVKAKVLCIRAEEADDEERKEVVDKIRRYLKLSSSYL
jgi:hypothetical protein